jgi:hypothetical protein
MAVGTVERCLACEAVVSRESNGLMVDLFCTVYRRGKELKPPSDRPASFMTNEGRWVIETDRVQNA